MALFARWSLDRARDRAKHVGLLECSSCIIELKTLYSRAPYTIVYYAIEQLSSYSVHVPERSARRRLLRHADLTIMGRVGSSAKLGLNKDFLAPCPGDCITLVTAASFWPERKISGSNFNSFGAKTEFPM